MMQSGPLARKIVIEGELMDLNGYIDIERGNMHYAAKMKKTYTEFVQYQTLSQKPLKEKEYPIYVIMHWYTKDLKKDPDNIAFAKKFVLDGLVKNKILKNDGRNQISGLADWFHVDKVNPRVEVFIYTAL